jgi:hypothetical protein
MAATVICLGARPDDGAEQAKRHLSKLRVDGRFFVTDTGTFRPVFASALASLPKPPAQRAAVLDEAAALGFNGVRVFAGDLGWANQTPELARTALPVFLREAADRGLYVYVSAITGSDTGYDAEAHLRAVADTCAAAANCVLEIANEFFHPTQSPAVRDPASLLALAQRVVRPGLPYALGAADVDTLDPSGRYSGEGGAFITAHLARGGDSWSMVARLREIAAISERTGKPAISGEPIGADEDAEPGRRENNPSVFFALGALSRLFEIGTVFHSEDGLNGKRLRPVQRQCAEAFIAGFRTIDTDARLAFKAVGAADSPVAGVAGAVRGHSAIHANRGWAVLVGTEGEPDVRLLEGWRVVATASSRPGVRVLALAR